MKDENIFGYPGCVHHSGYSRSLALESVGQGWSSLINEAFDFLESKGNPVKIIQVKEKYAGLRIYCDFLNDEIENKIMELQKRSFSICEKCGKEGTVRKTKTGWYLTTCNEHAGDSEIIKDFL